MKKLVVFIVSITFLFFLNANHVNAFDLKGIGKGLLGGGEKEEKTPAEEKKTPEQVLEEALKKIDKSKELRKQGNILRAEMNKAVSGVRQLQGVAGKTMYIMGRALQNAEHADFFADVKQEEMSALFDAKYDESKNLRNGVAITQQNTKQNKMLVEYLRTQTNKFYEMQELEHVSLDGIKYRLAQSIGSYEIISDNALEVIDNIDEAIKAFKEKGKPVAIESVKMIGILGIQLNTLSKEIKELKSKPLKGLKLLPKLKKVFKNTKMLINLLQNYCDDYNFIENNSGIIVVEGEITKKTVADARSINKDIQRKLIAIGIKSSEIDKYIVSIKDQQAKAFEGKKNEALKKMEMEEDEMDEEV